jgi:hypothetical protein
MGRRRSAPVAHRVVPTSVAAALAAVYLIWQPASLDLAAAEYRAWLFDHAGYAIWDAQWYGGHHLPGYSVLFPPLAGWLGPRLLGALAVVAATWLFERIAFDRYGAEAWVGATWFALGAASALFSGRITFLVGLGLALGAVLMLQRERRAAAVGLALATPLASPVAALFLALAGTAHALGARRGVGFGVSVAAIAPVALLALVFPEGGTEPFVSSAFWPVVALAVVALALLPHEQRVLRIGVALYALLAIALFAIETPVGGNVVRLGALCAGPVAALVLWPHRRLVLACIAPFLLWWQLGPAILDVTTAEADPSVEAAYYAPLLAELERRDAIGGEAGGRLEIPFTKVHWEARHMAASIPLARGWERQLDRKVNALFYEDGPLDAARYRAWLERAAVRWIAVPDVALDYSAKDEATLIAHGLPYLREVWSSDHWRLYEVAQAAPLAEPPARIVAVGTDSLTLAAPHAGSVRLRIRWSPYWAVERGDACVAPDGDWTRLRVRTAGTVHLTMDFSPLRIASRAARCGDLTAVNGG